MQGSAAVWQEGAGPPEVRRFLQGPQPRGVELVRVIRIAVEFMRGFRALHFVGPCVTVFGSARFHQDHKYYAMARKLGAGLARAGFAVMTGGGPGVMEAANRGAREAGGVSIGCNIELPVEQRPNEFLDKWISFHHFFVRKVMLVKYSYAFIALPGGFGTLDEIFEMATLVQTGKIRDFPLVLVGSEYWRPLVDFVQRLVTAGTVDAADADRIHLTDSVEAAVEIVTATALGQFGLTYGPRLRPRWWLGEAFR
jgi:uncharacterized protein (TIGR00730 family)